MVGQIWSVASEGGYLYSDELSDTIRQQVQPLCKFRQLCDMPDGDSKGLHAGSQFVWNVSLCNCFPIMRNSTVFLGFPPRDQGSAWV
jgi:hypothetical protein